MKISEKKTDETMQALFETMLAMLKEYDPDNYENINTVEQAIDYFLDAEEPQQ